MKKKVAIKDIDDFLLDQEIINNFKQILAHLPGNVYWKNRQGVYLGSNLAMIKIKNVVGHTLDEILSFEEAYPLIQADEAVMKEGKEHCIEEYGRDINGEEAIYLTRKVPLYNDQGEVNGLLGLSFDITERKKMEEALLVAKKKAEKANLAKSEFLALTSHELRTPLTAILGIANLLQYSNLTCQEKEEYIQHITTAGTQLLSLVNDILDFARLEADKYELCILPLNLKKFLEEIIVMLSITAKSKGIGLYIEYAPNFPHLVFGDPRALRQIFINLIGNAIKFTEKGFVKVKIYCQGFNLKQADFEIAIEDTGIGIPPDKIDIIFERFQQVDSPYQRTYTGTGLGLAITLQLAQLMNAQIKVKSEVGKGSTFTMNIQFLLQNPATIESSWAKYASQVRVLIIDDSAQGEVLRQHIGTAQSQVVSSDNAIHTLVAFQQLGQPFDIIIIDDDIKSNSPETLLQELSRHQYIKKTISLLLASKESMQDNQALYKQGLIRTLLKPFTPGDLHTVLTALWEKAKLQ